MISFLESLCWRQINTATLPQRWNGKTWFWNWPRPTEEGTSFSHLQHLHSIILEYTFSDLRDMWNWDSGGIDVFTVAKARRVIDETTLPVGFHITKWNKYIPRKVDILYRQYRLNRLPTRLNLNAKWLNVPLVVCSICVGYGRQQPHVYSL